MEIYFAVFYMRQYFVVSYQKVFVASLLEKYLLHFIRKDIQLYLFWKDICCILSGKIPLHIKVRYRVTDWKCPIISGGKSMRV